MLDQPFYDPGKTYEENYDKGPYGAFANPQKFINKGEPTYDFLGHKVYLPFGIPAGPLLNSKYIKSSFEMGFDIAVYKTVRSDFFPCHPYPNVLSVNLEGNLSLGQDKLIADDNYHEPLSITNSFGVPSKKPDTWQEDVKRAISYTGLGQVMILSFMGTVRPNQTQEEFIDDYALAAKLAYETGAKVLEVNLSCPNIGNEGLVCYNLDVTQKVCQKIRANIGNVPLILKVGYYKDNESLERLLEIANEYANDVAAINTLQTAVVGKNGEQALPGPNRLRSGVCGAGIKWAGLDMVKRLKNIRDTKGYKLSITGVGGVTIADDYFEYKEAGADCVMSATGAMWNPHLAQEIKRKIEEA